MRAATTAQNTALAGPYYTVGLRVLIADSDGNLRDWSNQGGVNWIDSVEIDQDVDQPVNGATVTLRRDAGSTLSLAPLRTDSTLNRNNVSAYAPAIDAGRLVVIQVATVAAGTTPVSGDYIELFRGEVDRVTWAASAMTLTCRDLGCRNADRYVKTKTVYGTDSGVPLESVMQAILTDWGDGSTLCVPTSPSFHITTYEQQENQSVIDALLALAQTCGWTLRTIWNPTAGAFQLALLNPNRTKSTPDQTIAPSRYLTVTDLFIDRTNIRNDFTLNYTDESTGPSSVAASDGVSQSEYGYRWMGITESSTSPINTASEASTMVLAMRDDLKDPKAEHEITLHHDWRVEINDLLKLQANGVHYDTDQTGAVVTLKHQLTPTSHRTTVRTRGQPAGQYLNWFLRGIGTPITQGPNLAVAAKQSGTNYVITWTGDDVSLSTDGGATWGTPSPSPITVAMNASGGAAKVYTFQGYRDGVSIQIPVTIPAQSGSTAPSLSLTPSIGSTQVDDSSGSVNLTLGATNLPTAYTWTLYSGYTRGKLTTILASGSQSSNPLSGTPVVAISPQAKLFTWCTLVVTVGSDKYSTDVVVNPYQPAFATSGAVNRGVALSDGGYAARAVDAGGSQLHVSVTDSTGTRSVASMFSRTVDTLDNVTDGTSYFKTNQNQRDGGGRAYAGLDGSGYVTSGVRAAAVIADQLAGNVSKRLTSLFADVFDVAPGSGTGWSAGGVAAITAAGSGATVGKNIARWAGGFGALEWGTPIPFNPNKLYRIRARIRTAATNTAGSSYWYIGVFCCDTTGAHIANSNSGVAYICASAALPALGTWTEYIGWFKGASLALTTYPGAPSTDAGAPAALSVGTTLISPMVYAGYNGTGGTFEMDYFYIDEFDEDGSARTYGALDSGYNLKPTVAANNGNTWNIASGRVTQTGLSTGGSLSFFGGNFQHPPLVALKGGAHYRADSVWGTSDPSGSTEAGSSAPTSSPQIVELQPYNVTASGGSVRARLRQSGSPTGRTNAFPNTAITTVGGYQVVTASNAPASDDTYTASFAYAFTATGGSSPSSLNVVVALDYWNGSSWVTVATRTYSASDPGTHALGDGSCGASGSDSMAAVVSGLTSSSQFRLTIQSASGAGTRTLEVDPGNLTYSTAGSPQYANMTPAGVTLTAETIGAS